MDEQKKKNVTFSITPEAEAVLAMHKEYGYVLKQDFLNEVLISYQKSHPINDQKDAFTPEQEIRLKALIRQVLEKEGYRPSYR